MKYKIGDKVTLVGDDGWNSQIKKDIGLIGTIVKIYDDGSVFLEMPAGASSWHWSINGNKGIKKVEEQMLFPFMYD